jgi:hypothetical protein
VSPPTRKLDRFPPEVARFAHMSCSAPRWAIALVLVAASTSASACGAGSRGSGSALPTTSTDLEAGADFTASGFALDRFTRRVRHFMNGFATCRQGSNMTRASPCLAGAAPVGDAVRAVVERLNRVIPRSPRACAVALHTLGETAISFGFATMQVTRAWQPGNAFGVRAVLARLAESISPYFRALKRASSQCEYAF